MKTTKEAAEILGIKPAKLASILAKYPSYRPTATFGLRPAWTDADIEEARKIVTYVEQDICPHCGQLPGATTTSGSAGGDVEPDPIPQGGIDDA